MQQRAMAGAMAGPSHHHAISMRRRHAGWRGREVRRCAGRVGAQQGRGRVSTEVLANTRHVLSQTYMVVSFDNWSID